MLLFMSVFIAMPDTNKRLSEIDRYVLKVCIQVQRLSKHHMSVFLCLQIQPQIQLSMFGIVHLTKVYIITNYYSLIISISVDQSDTFTSGTSSQNADNRKVCFTT